MVTRLCSTDRKPLSIVAVCCWPDVGLDADVALDEDAEQGGVPGEDAELALHGARDDLAGLALPHLAVSGDQLDVQLTHRILHSRTCGASLSGERALPDHWSRTRSNGPVRVDLRRGSATRSLSPPRRAGDHRTGRTRPATTTRALASRTSIGTGGRKSSQSARQVPRELRHPGGPGEEEDVRVGLPRHPTG